MTSSISPKILLQYQYEKKIRARRHPELPLTIYNYTEHTQYGKHWDDVTLLTRGLITDDSGQIVGRSFRKFFNYDEGRHVATPDYVLYNKLDGSLLILFNYANQWLVASRGSFISEQADKARDILRGKDLSLFDRSCSYVFEIIYPSNRIVIDYGDREELVYLATFENATGAERFDDTLMRSTGFTCVEKINHDDYDYESYVLKDTPNEEGAVVVFSNGDRVKLKFDT